MQRSARLPNPDRLSVLTATILLTYALSIFIDLPGRQFALRILGFTLSIEISAQTLLALLVAAMTATGTQWLLQDHPAIRGKPTFQHWLLPALSAWVISIPLFQLPIGLQWWIGFLVGGALLALVLVAEYIVVDPEDIRQPPAAAGLTAISFALYLVLATALRYTGSRLFILLAALTLAVSLVSLRTLHLRLHGYWAVIESGVIALITAQLATALHYWPLSPVSFGLILLGPAYALTTLMGNLSEGESLRQAIVEPFVVLILVWLTAFWIR
jgi:hypothetical protein